jgi:hypothetical protein
MKITRSYLKQLILEELGSMEERQVVLPFSEPGKRPGIDVGDTGMTQGPEAPGDELYQAIYNATQSIEFMLSKRELKEIGGGYYATRLSEIKDRLDAALEMIENKTER